jgi:hypothetical protein
VNVTEDVGVMGNEVPSDLSLVQVKLSDLYSGLVNGKVQQAEIGIELVTSRWPLSIFCRYIDPTHHASVSKANEDDILNLSSRVLLSHSNCRLSFHHAKESIERRR